MMLVDFVGLCVNFVVLLQQPLLVDSLEMRTLLRQAMLTMHCIYRQEDEYALIEVVCLHDENEKIRISRFTQWRGKSVKSKCLPIRIVARTDMKAALDTITPISAFRRPVSRKQYNNNDV